MSPTIKLRKEWFSNQHVEICNQNIQFLGQERHMLRRHADQNKEEIIQKKICNTGLNFLRKEWKYNSLNEGERRKRKKIEAEAGKYSAVKNSC